MIRYLAIIAGWLFPPFFVVSLPLDIPGVRCLAMLYLYLLGPWLCAGFFFLFLLTRKKPQALVAWLLASSLWLLTLWNGFAFGARIHLLFNEERYAKTIKLVARAKSGQAKATVCADQCIAHSTAQLVTFHYCHCMQFWPDLVYDPSGELDVDRNNLQKLDFYLHSARHLTTFWYIGYYGD